jgi:ATP-binding cassette subfamily A (ABC1) protein 5
MSQLKALLKRNLLMKKYMKSQTLTEIFFPVFMILMTYFINKATETRKYDAVGPTETQDLNLFFTANYMTYMEKDPVIGFILPENNQDEGIINRVMQNDIFKQAPMKGMHFKNQEEMAKFADDYHNCLIAGVVFESDDYLNYSLRVNSTSVPLPTADPITNYAIARYQVEQTQSAEADSYLLSFSPIQAAIDQAIIQTRTNDDNFVLKHNVGKLGKAASEYSVNSSGNTLASYIAVIFMMPIVIIVVSIVQEKEKGIRDGLLMAGTHPTVFWLSWLILYIVVCFLISLFVAVFFHFTGTFSNCNPIILFLSVLLYGVSCCSLGFVFSTFFKKTKTAGTVIALIMVVLAYSNFLSDKISLPVKKVISLFISPITIGSFVYEVNAMENHFQNLTFGNLLTTDAGIFFFILIINNVLYFVLALIFDNLFSNESARYLFGGKKNISELRQEGDVTYDQDIQEDFNAKNGETCVVEVSRVHKVFQRKKEDDSESEDNGDSRNKNKRKTKGKEFLAVDDVSFKVYQNEIFAILGHNGAGKTTLINIMVGLLKATQGDVFFDGRSIAKDTSSIRKEFGVCAQSNIIYDEITVEDHINFYAGLKGITVNVDEVLKDLDLLSQKTTKASKLSGGQKRKLCIGMATIGDPKYIFLDEPTTGLDPLSRRKIWDLLSKKKEGRVIFLTTHYMDEADILADRKVIITKGKVRCLGTSLFLKNHFNMSYNLDVETDDCQRVNDLIQSYIPESTYVYEQEHEQNREKSDMVHTWRLPLNTTNKFSHLIDELERQSDGSDGCLIKKFGLSMPTLEELFIRLEDNDFDDETNINSEEQHLIQTDSRLPQLNPVEKPSRFQLLKSLVKYRLKIFLKDKGFAFYNLLFPVISTAIIFIFINKLLSGNRVKTDSKILSVPEIYSDALINLDPESTLNITAENVISVVGKNVKNIPLKDIANPENNDPYYLASISGAAVSGSQYNLDVYYNDTMTHSVPVTFNAISNSILASKNINGRIVMKSHPYETNDDTLAIIGLSLAGFMIGYSIVGCISKFGPLIVRERVNQLLQQLQLNGVSRVNYWISCFLSDNILFLFSCILIFIAGVVVQFQPLMDVKILIIIFILLLVWSVPTMLYQYVLNFIFDKEETAFSMMSLINSYSVMFGYIIFFFINMSNSEDIIMNIIAGKGLFSTKAIIYNMVVTAIFPTYGIVGMIHCLFTIKMYEKLVKYDASIMNIIKFGNGITPIFLVCVALIFILFFLLIKFDTKKNQTNASDINELPSDIRAKYEDVLAHGDDDVYEEFNYVKAHERELPVSVLHLSKEYKAKLPSDKSKKKAIMNGQPDQFKFGDIHKSFINGKIVKTAVIDVNFGVRNHECFGLLGPNGAGKSTTLNSITSTMPQTTGRICFNGVETHVARLGEISMGYCPQNDILWKELTLREHLEFFLNIRGYNSAEAKEYASQYINCLGLEEHQNKRVEKLSGGTKRKLSLLIAICGYPKQIFLDEPSAGMDPSTRRMVWNIIKKTKSMNDSALIMTTHSMEEAENLCDRLGILINGRLTCIGSPEHLKMKFGEGYILEIQSHDVDRFHKEIVENGKIFGDCEYTQERSSRDRSKYVVKINRNLGHVFEVMEQCKNNGIVTDYSFNQTSLEQIFINFAKDQIINTDSS